MERNQEHKKKFVALEITKVIPFEGIASSNERRRSNKKAKMEYFAMRDINSPKENSFNSRCYGNGMIVFEENETNHLFVFIRN